MKKIGMLVALALYLPAAEAAFRCTDAKGQRHVGDTPPPGCATVPMEEITTSGKVLRVIEPTLTPEQIKAKQEEAERKKAADKVAAEQKRKDMALLSTFSSEKEFDVTRDRTIEPIRGRIKLAQERLSALDKQEARIKDELEFYKAGKSKGKAKEPPSNLTEGLKSAEQERANINKSIAAHEKDIEDIKAKFDVDKKRWIALKSGSGSAPEKAAEKAPDKPAAPAAAPAPKKN